MVTPGQHFLPLTMSAESRDQKHHETDTFDPYSKPEVYYGGHSFGLQKERTFSDIVESGTPQSVLHFRKRSASLDAGSKDPRRFLIPVESTLKELLSQEDSDHNCQITIDDEGPKVSPTYLFSLHYQL